MTDDWDPDALDTDEMILQMGPQHPATHGVLRVELRTDGEIVKAARPHIGYLHRCFEKHCENVDYAGRHALRRPHGLLRGDGQHARLRPRGREAPRASR